ncbi:MAG: SUMF1/EgtB/PvdO family nonheme iron enzyme [Planctomycetes bacterium]|nr:SUMF1/EgtB/PvdO family nonheme iron enzyme [Planctomycetota bacterium]
MAGEPHPGSDWRGFGKAILRGLVKSIPVVGEAIAACIEHAEQQRMNAMIEQVVSKAAGGNPEVARALSGLPRAQLEEAVRTAVDGLPAAEREKIARGMRGAASAQGSSGRPAGAAVAGADMALGALAQALGTVAGAAPLHQTLSMTAHRLLVRGRAFEPGTKIDGRYEVLRFVGAGALGSVYRAQDLQLEEPVALKMIWPELLTDPGCALRFVQEVKLCLKLRHDSIVQALAVRRGKRAAYLCMEWVEGTTLQGLLDEERRLAWTRAEPIAWGVLDAVAYAHRTGMLHLNLNLRNVLLPRLDSPKVADFGLAGGLLRAARKAAAGLEATQDFVAPEVRGGAVDGDRRADVYSAAALLHEVLLGVPPGEDRTLLDALRGVPDAVKSGLRAGLETDPALRPEDGTALREALFPETAGPRSPAGRRRPGREAGRARLAAAGSEREPAALPAAPRELAPAPPPRRQPQETARPSPLPTERSSPAPAALPAPPRAPVPAPVPAPAPADACLGPTLRNLPGLTLVGPNERGRLEWRNPKDGSVLIALPAGEFRMGSADQEDACPLHNVVLDAYLIGRFPVTNAQYGAFCRATGHAPPSPPPSGAGHAAYFMLSQYREYPVIGVSWDDATAYCTWAGLRLPTEAEWERAAGWDDAAARARRYPWGEEPPDAERAVFGRTIGGGAYTELSGGKATGASPCGALDMGGNVWEWCADWYDAGAYAARAPLARSPAGPVSGSLRVLRGGAWCDPPSSLHVAAREASDPSFREYKVGFRVARSPA